MQWRIYENTGIEYSKMIRFAKMINIVKQKKSLASLGDEQLG
jgi:hypothetical protein